ncbi:MAG: hypothetical protein R2880_19715 [Deinococcales bacterium]
MRKDSYQIGRLLVIFGSIILVLRMFTDISFSSLWPLILVALGFYQRYQGGDRRQARSLIIIGFVLLAFTTGLLSLASFNVIWPFAIIALGIYLLAKSKGSQVQEVFEDAAERASEGFQLGAERLREVFERPRDEAYQQVQGDEGERLNMVILFGSSQTTPPTLAPSNSATCFFGDLKIDLRSLKPTASGAKLELTCAFGDVDVRVPEAWRVELNSSNFMADIKSECASPLNPQGILYINANCFFGDITISH